MAGLGPTRPGSLLYLSYADVRQLLDPRTALEVSEATLMQHADDQVVWSEPRQMRVDSSDYPTTLKYKGCILQGSSIAGSRIVSLNRTRSGKRVASTQPTKFVLLTDPETGAHLALVDEHWSYGLRTGAGVAIATKYLAVKGAKRLAMLGTGDMAEATLLVLAEAMSLEQVRVYSRNADNRDAFSRRMAAQLEIPIQSTETAQQAVAEAEVICAATTARAPFVEDEWIPSGSLTYTMGEFQEIASDFYRKADKIIVDDWEQVKIKVDIAQMLETGELQATDIYADFAAVVSGSKPGRTNDHERILVRSQGLVTQDVALAYWVYQRALEVGLGHRLAL